VAGAIVFGIMGILFTLFGVLGLVTPKKKGRDIEYTDREFFFMTLAGIGNIVAAAMLLNRLLGG
jgi:hypothetical protein